MKRGERCSKMMLRTILTSGNRFHEVRIENTNSCGYKCLMCPRESQTRKIGFMSLDDFSLILERLGSFSGSFHLHGFGEPLLDRQLIPKIALLKKRFPACFSLIFSTLGVRLPEDHFEKLVEAGLSHLVISLYGYNREDYQRIHGFNGWDLARHNLELLSKAQQQSRSFQATIKISAPDVFSSLPLAKSSEREVFCKWAKELGFHIQEWEYLHNYGSGRHYNLPSNRLCPVVEGKRKGILNITWDLHVIPCCFDFNATIRFGNLREQSLEDIFSSPEYLNFLIAHKTNSLSSHPVCQNCEKHDL